MKTKEYALQLWSSQTHVQLQQERFKTFASHLQKLGIICHSDSAFNDVPFLFLNDENTSEQEEIECFQAAEASNVPVFVLYLGEKRLPFYRIWRLLGLGAEDVFSCHNHLEICDNLLARLKRRAYLDALLDSDRIKKYLIGYSPLWKKTLRQVIEIACFSTAPVLILGESGTGKELIAKLIHDLDKRPDKQALVLLDCTTIAPELSGSEFFGHEKGAFTNAIASRDGAFALADRGTLFLDEAGELPLNLQAELLRVSQEGMYKRVGSNIWKKAQFRLICATNRNLLQEVEKGNFRQDLYYRLSTCVIQLPPLRERQNDIPALAQHFLGQILQTDAPPPLDALVENFLMTHPYPGNIRQLRQLVTRIAYRYTGHGPITMGDIPHDDRQMVTFSEHSWQENGFKSSIRQALTEGIGLKDIKRIAAEVAMDIAIKEAAGNLQEAAKRLEVSDRLVQGYWAEKKS